MTPSGTKIAHELSDLADFGGVSVDELRPVLETLGERRIVRSVEEGGDVRYEIFHDVLAEPVLAWRTAHEADRELRRQKTESDRRHRRLLGVIAVGGVLLSAMAGVTVYALSQRTEARDQAREARAHQLEAESAAGLPLDPERSLLLAREAARLYPSETAEEALRTALIQSRVRTVVDVGEPLLGAVLNGDDVLAATASGSLVVADGSTGATSSTFPTGAPARHVSFAESGVALFTGRDGVLRVVNATGEVQPIPGVEEVDGAEISPDGTLAVLVGRDGARLIDVKTGTVERTFPHRGAVSAAISGDNRRVATGAADDTVRLWARTGTHIRTLVGHKGHPTALAFGPSAASLASASTDGVARIWQAGDGRLTGTLEGDATALTDVGFSTDGAHTVTSSRDGTVRVSNAEVGVILGRPDREVQRKGSRRTAARPRALHRVRAGGATCARGRRAGGKRRLRLRGGGADRARDLRRLPREGPALNYGGLGDSRTKRTVTGMARVLRALRLDGMLLSGLIAVTLFGLFVLWSAAGDNTSLWFSQVARVGIGFTLLVVLSQVPDHFLRMLSPAAYLLGLVLLVVVALAGDIGKGAQRWLDLGVVRFQPSEIMKLAVPMMCAWYLHQRPLPPSLRDVGALLLIVLLPVGLIAEQPDLGTALLVAASGVIVLVMGGLSWATILGGVAVLGAAVPVGWHFLHDYQRQRVLTLLDPQSDALGAGYHIIQSQIAIGSGGVFGKGWMNGSQAQLEFLPERSTDFIFAVIGEELGLLGLIALLAGYLFIVGRGMTMALQCRDAFARLLAGSIALTFFVYAFVNAGMVMGLLPVVGVPLPLVSYGGTSFVTLMAGFGILMALHSSRKLVG